MNRKNNKSISLRCIITWMSRKHSTNKTIVTIKDLLSGPSFYVLFASLFYAIRSLRYIIKPQLYAEDGAVWLADGFNLGIKSLFIPLNGFSHLFERLFGLVVVKLPLMWAPFLFNLTAFGLFCLTVYYLYTPRTKILTTNFERIFVLASLCLIANVDEFFFNFSNSIFLLGIVGILLIVVRKSSIKIVNYLETMLFMVICLTLPFAWLYLGILLINRFYYHKKQVYLLVIATLGSIVQLLAYLNRDDTRSSISILALFSKNTILEIYNQILIPAITFTRLDINPDVPLSVAKVALLILVFLSSITIAIIVFFKSNHQTKLLFLFIAGITFAILRSPLVQLQSTDEILNFMANAKFGDRYFVYGILGISIAFAKFGSMYIPKPFRLYALGVFISAGMATSIYTNSFMINKGFVDLTKEYSKGVEQLQTVDMSKQDVVIPINPGGGWIIRFSIIDPQNHGY